MLQQGSAKVVELDRQTKQVVWTYDSSMQNGNEGKKIEVHAFQPLEDGNVMIAESGVGRIIEVNRAGEIQREIKLQVKKPHPHRDKAPKGGHGPEAWGNQCFGAVRLPNGNTLIATGNGHSVLEVSPAKEIVWKIEQNDLPNITLAWVTTLEVLPNGNYVIGNCHAGSKNPLVVEIEPKSKKVVWTFDQFDTFGNSVPNTQLLDLLGQTIR
jgi:outer membrane protein assembly factor BamB